MTDINDITSAKIIEFCNYQMQNNKMGIGNECTHFVYAALFEVNAEDGVTRKHPTIQQGKVPYIWGRSLGPREFRSGDVTQFQSHNQSTFFYYDGRWGSWSKKRAPNHTGIASTGNYFGEFSQFESHIHDEGMPNKMSIRTNRVYIESYAIVVTTSGIANKSWPPEIAYFLNNLKTIPENEIYWGVLRQYFEVSLNSADSIKKMIKSEQKPTYRGNSVAIFFEVRVVGSVNFYRPENSVRRQKMSDVERAAEKSKLINAMIRSGRPGSQEDGDSKADRLKLGAFSWDYPKN